MINLPYNVPLMSQLATGQAVPMQTSHTVQTAPSVAFGSIQDPFKQPYYQFVEQDMFTNHQFVPNVRAPGNPYQPIFQTTGNTAQPAQIQPNSSALPQNILDQIRGYVSNAPPIFILPAGCHQSTNHHQQAPALNQGGVSQPAGQSTGFNYPPSIYCPPPFYPYPIPLPVYDTFASQTRGKENSQSCGCCQRRQDSGLSRNYPPCCSCKIDLEESHRCTATNDDTICSQRNCPASISLQALASQLLSVPGIISCAATRLILRKVPGSNITSPMEDTMDRAQKSVSVLNKDQLLAESRNAQQVNGLISLHMTTNPPANIVPLLTLLQIKMNVLKAQVECLINKKVMECQGYGAEVETSGPIDPTVLSLKTNEELRQLLFALRQKECDERVNVNFSPYHSQKVIAEARLNNVQAKLRQVEAEFDRRRCVPVPTPTLTSRVIQQFSEARCTFGFAHTRLLEPYTPETVPQSPDPFVLRNPRRLLLTPRTVDTETTQKDMDKGTSTQDDVSPAGKDIGTDADSKERSVESRCSADSSSCGETSSDESLREKKKLRLKIDRGGNVTISSVAGLRDVSLMKLSPNVVTKVDGKRIVKVGELKLPEDSDPSKIEDAVDRRSKIRGSFVDGRKGDDAPGEKMREDSLEMKRALEKDEGGDGVGGRKNGDTWPMMRKEDVKSEMLHDEKLEIKEGVEHGEDVGEKLHSGTKIKVEPESTEDMETSDYGKLPIKKEETKDGDEEKEPLLGEKTEVKSEPKVEGHPESKQETKLPTDEYRVETKIIIGFDPVEPKVSVKKETRDPEEGVESTKESIHKEPRKDDDKKEAVRIEKAEFTWGPKKYPEPKEEPPKDKYRVEKKITVGAYAAEEPQVSFKTETSEPEEGAGSTKKLFTTAKTIPPATIHKDRKKSDDKTKPVHHKKTELKVEPKVKQHPEPKQEARSQKDFETAQLQKSLKKEIPDELQEVVESVKELFEPTKTIPPATIHKDRKKSDDKTKPVHIKKTELKVEPKVKQQPEPKQEARSLKDFETAQLQKSLKKEIPDELEEVVEHVKELFEPTKTIPPATIHKDRKKSDDKTKAVHIKKTELKVEPKVKQQPEPKQEARSLKDFETGQLQVPLKKKTPDEPGKVVRPAKPLFSTGTPITSHPYFQNLIKDANKEPIKKTAFKWEPKGNGFVVPQLIEGPSTSGVVVRKVNTGLKPPVGPPASLKKETEDEAKDGAEFAGNIFNMDTISMGPGVTKLKARILRDREIPKRDQEKMSTDQDESQGKSKETNVRIVSMLTSIEYDHSFDDYGKLVETNEEYRHERNFRNNSSEDMNETMNDENCASRDMISENLDSLMIAAVNKKHEAELSVINMADKTCEQDQTYAPFKEILGEEVDNGDEITCLPSKRHTTQSGRKSKKISRNTNFWKTVRASSHTKTKQGIASTIYSTIENQLASFTSAVGKIPYIRTVLSNLYSNELSSNPGNGNVSPMKRETTDDRKRNKTLASRNNDWILLSSNANTSGTYDYGKVRKIKHSIIVNKEKKNCLLIRGSISGQSKELSGNGFKRPFETRRCLLIRSRLKKSKN